MPLSLFQGFGVELEYMIVDRGRLTVLPVADAVLKAVAGEYVGDVEMGPIGWSNELALHVIELKTVDPVTSLDDLPRLFNENVAKVNALLEPVGGRLMPSGMHPLMDPAREMRLWPHEYSPVYEAFDRIFGCKGHGWANLQSVHLNLPFDGDEEFGRLHAAVRLILPILPAIAASSPFMDGRATGVRDTRLSVYRTNARRVPSVSGRVIPERVFTKAQYEGLLLAGIYGDLAPLDPEGILRHEWVNARGAIARFVRNSIEIRVLDVQECPLADVAVCAAIVAVLGDLVAERWCGLADQQAWEIDPLETILLRTIDNAEEAVIDDPAYLKAFGMAGTAHATAGELWRHLVETSLAPRGDAAAPWLGPLNVILGEGSLSTHIARSVGPGADRSRILATYERLCNALSEGTMFHAAG